MAPRLQEDDVILIAETKRSLHPNEEPVRYIMKFARCEFDANMNSVRIWGKSWPYMLIGKSCKKLKNPFDITKIQVSSKNYRQGGTFMYIEQADEMQLRENGYLDTID